MLGIKSFECSGRHEGMRTAASLPSMSEALTAVSAAAAPASDRYRSQNDFSNMTIPRIPARCTCRAPKKSEKTQQCSVEIPS